MEGILHGYFSTLGHGVYGIKNEVYYALLDLVIIPTNLWYMGVQIP